MSFAVARKRLAPNRSTRLAWPARLFLAAIALLVAAEAGASKPNRGKKRGAPSNKTLVVFETSKGSFTIALDQEKAPLSSANLLSYVDTGYYNGTIFHRVISDFMVQGGGFTKDLQKKPAREPIKNEADNGLSNVRGSVAMARTNVVDSATSQFFINVKDNRQLDHSPANFGYAVVGEVVSGMDVVDAIRATPVLCPSVGGEPACSEPLPPGMRDVPVTPIVVLKAHRKSH